MRDAHGPHRRAHRRLSLLAGPSRQTGAPRTAGVIRIPTTSATAEIAGFPVMDLHRQELLYPTDQANQPPDTQLAAGPTSLAEADNSTLSVWSKSGVFLTSADLNVFFGAPPGYDFSDPRLLYDPESGRWFLSGLAENDLRDSQTYIAVSTTSDPAGDWDRFVLATHSAVVTDQPMIGVDSDKVVVSWNDFSGSPPATPTFTGQETYVLQKSDLLNHVAPAAAIFGPDTTRFRIMPALTLTAGTSTEWLAYNEAHCVSGCGPGITALGVVAITGTPSAGNVAWTEADPTFAETNRPPAPRQPGGVAVTTQIDDRFLSAIWRNGTLWVAGNDACVPPGDSAARACLRLVQVATGATPSVLADFDVSSSGVDLYYPAVATDPAGDIFIAYTKSSPAIFPTAAAVSGPAGTPADLGNEVVLAAGEAAYLRPPSNRWGDYSAAAPDPIDPAHVWLTAEYQASAADPAGWGTATGELAFAMPTSRSGVTQSSPAPTPGPR
jgi:hypothetical protein